MHVVVAGASRGIGLEFVRQLLQRGDTVTAGCRAPSASEGLAALSSERLRVLALDVTEDASVEAFASALGSAPVDVLINNAGVSGGWESLSGVRTEEALRTFNTNALGPLRVTRALLPQLRAGKRKVLAHLSSGMGSIGDNSSGGAYAYRMSKAALNMASRNLAVELGKEGFVSVVLNPGWVQTDMGGKGAPVDVRDSVRGMLARLDALTPAQNGAFLDWRKDEGYPW